ncbi:RNA 2',3'-cyclic phosphodiesterase [Glutamicibacter protophormiae]|uniref:RNA 2',3'-cyclic phosphodiesterase n=1 Tax=Kocuria sp. TaxID=1871328 RepID=UPI002647BAEE|nr:RNA 2',3'-cyclic phosphodiesterase [Kocuria sp.]MDN5631830.1 RNA 2',3'-cyclic phosphodiesterase [Kocuria sp.]WNB88518.1 RNA 2',3'-cyclic phosphodiesterase [Glutamicibacter protophormiae]
MRLFAAAHPPRAAREHLVRAMTEVRALTGTALRWGDPEQWHVTLAFYGDQPEGAVPDLSEHLGEVARGFPPLRVSLHGVGSFSGTTLWVGVGGQTTELTELMHACSLDPDERARQRAHLTVARTSRTERTRQAKEQRRGSRVRAHTGPELAHVVHALSVYDGPEWTVREISLVASELGRGRSGGTLHTDMGRYVLTGA